MSGLQGIYYMPLVGISYFLPMYIAGSYSLMIDMPAIFLGSPDSIDYLEREKHLFI